MWALAQPTCSKIGFGSRLGFQISFEMLEDQLSDQVVC